MTIRFLGQPRRGLIRFASAAAAPLALWDGTAKNSTVVRSNGNLTVLSAAATHSAGRANSAAVIGSGVKRYWELTVNVAAGENDVGLGVANASNTYANDTYLGNLAHGLGYYNSGSVFLNAAVVTTLATYSATNVIRVAATGGSKIWFAVGAGQWNNTTDDPATATGGLDISTLGDIFPAYNVRNNASVTANFGETAFAHTPPSGFSGF